jgi:hypothetical protein
MELEAVDSSQITTFKLSLIKTQKLTVNEHAWAPSLPRQLVL